LYAEGFESTPDHVLLGDTFRIFLSYASWLSGCFLCSFIPINAFYAFLVCTVPCPIYDRETNSQYDLRNFTSPFLDFPIQSTRDFLLQSGLFDNIIVVFGQDKLDIESWWRWWEGWQPIHFATEQEEKCRCEQKWGAITKTMFNSEVMA